MKLRDQDREQIQRDFLTEIMGQVDVLRLRIDTFLNKKSLWKVEATKTGRKKKNRTK